MITPLARPARIGLESFTFPHLDPLAVIDVAAAAGFEAVGIRVVDPAAQRATLSPRQAERVAERARTAGIDVFGADIVDLEGPRDQWAHWCEVAAATGAGHIGSFHRGADVAAARARFSSLADCARTHGITAHLEPVSYFGIRDLRTALQVVGGDGGVTVDALQFGRAGDDLALLAEAAHSVPLWVQLCDGPTRDTCSDDAVDQTAQLAEIQHESVAARLLPGEGGLEVDRFLRTILDHTTDKDPTILVESPHSALIDELGAGEYARRCRDSVDALLSTILKERE